MYIKTAEGIDLIKRLAKDADVFVRNMRPGAIDHLGVGACDLMAVNPELIYCSISGFGQTGPWMKKMTYDPLVQSSAGTVAAMARPESQSAKPTLVNALIVDKTTAMTASQALLAALYARDVQGAGGQHIDLSMYDAHFAFNWVDLYNDHYFANDGVTLEPSEDPGLSHTIVDPSGRVVQKPLIPELFGIAETKDGKHVTVMMSFFKEHAELFNRPDIVTDTRFRPPHIQTREGQVWAREELCKTFKEFTFDEVNQITEENNFFGAPVME